VISAVEKANVSNYLYHQYASHRWRQSIANIGEGQRYPLSKRLRGLEKGRKLPQCGPKQK